MRRPCHNVLGARQTLRLVYAAAFCALGVVFASPRLAADVSVPQVNGALGHPGDDESLLVQALQEVKHNQLDLALGNLEQLVHRNPKFRLAQLVYADLLLAKAGPIARFGNFPAAPMEVLEGLRYEAEQRFKHHLDHPKAGAVPEQLLRMAESQQQVLVVDTAQSRLYVFENRGGKAELVGDFYATIGKNGPRKHREGDQKTPLGVYFITGRIPSSKLPDLYGAGAFPVNYPNEWDRRRGRTGHGIWIHGVPTDTFSRPPRASDGCVALSNADLVALSHVLAHRDTPVIISDGIRWINPAERDHRMGNFRAIFDQWLHDWESLDTERYLEHYSEAFSSGDKDYRRWGIHKRKVNARKRYVRVGASDLSAYVYPGESRLIVVTFEQDYRSSNYNRRLRKRQYWRQEADGHWRILYESTI
jgi:murein L,D-transpeptidase YafK